MQRRAGPNGFVVFRIAAPPAELERLVAELSSLGTLGVEEREAELLAYFGASAGAETASVLGLADPERHISVSGPARVPDADWEREWRNGLAPRHIAGLWIRPSWCASAGEPELVIDPQQAFGSGEHASTRLALALLLEALRPGETLLDVGTGSGILALAGLRRGAARAVAFDTDPIAIANAAENRDRNRLPLALYCGGLEALSKRARFDVGVANLLLHELLPCLPALAARTRRALVLSGQLELERGRLAAALPGADWLCVRERTELQSGETWCARLLLHRDSLQPASSASSVSSSA
jgi:ribosomal protein L11 methyltransferase